MRIKWTALVCMASMSSAVSAASYQLMTKVSSRQAEVNHLATQALFSRQVLHYPQGIDTAHVQTLHQFKTHTNRGYLVLKTDRGFYVYQAQMLSHMISPYGQWHKVTPKADLIIQDVVVDTHGRWVVATNHGIYRVSDNGATWKHDAAFNQGNVQDIALLKTADGKMHACVASQGYVDCDVKGQWQQVAGSTQQLVAAKSQPYLLQATTPVQTLSFAMPGASVSQSDPTVEIVYTYTSDDGKVKHLTQSVNADTVHQIDLGAVFREQDTYGQDNQPLLKGITLDDPYWYVNHQLSEVEVFFYDRADAKSPKKNVIGYAHFKALLSQYSPEYPNMAGSINLVPASPGGQSIQSRYGWQLIGSVNDGDYHLALTQPQHYNDKQSLSDNEAVSVPFPSQSTAQGVSMELYYGPSTAYNVYANDNSYLKMDISLCDPSKTDAPLTAEQVLSGLTLYDRQDQPVTWQHLASNPGGFLYTNVQGPYSPVPSAQYTGRLGALNCSGVTSHATLYLRANQVANGSAFYATYHYTSSLGYGSPETLSTKQSTLSTPVNSMKSPYFFSTKNFALSQCKKANPDDDYYGFTAKYQCKLNYDPNANPGRQVTPEVQDIQFVKFSGWPYAHKKSAGSRFRLIMPAIQADTSAKMGPWTTTFIRPEVADSLKVSLRMKGHDVYGDSIDLVDVGSGKDPKTGEPSTSVSLPSGDLKDKEGGVVAAMAATNVPLCNAGGYDSTKGNCKKLSITMPPGYSANVIWPDNYILARGDYNYDQGTNSEGWKDFVKAVDAYTAVSVTESISPSYTAVTASGGGSGNIIQYVND